MLDLGLQSTETADDGLFVLFIVVSCYLMPAINRQPSFRRMYSYSVSKIQFLNIKYHGNVKHSSQIFIKFIENEGCQ